jgi:hypothetical protein
VLVAQDLVTVAAGGYGNIFGCQRCAAATS